LYLLPFAVQSFLVKTSRKVADRLSSVLGLINVTAGFPSRHEFPMHLAEALVPQTSPTGWI